MGLGLMIASSEEMLSGWIWLVGLRRFPKKSKKMEKQTCQNSGYSLTLSPQPHEHTYSYVRRTDSSRRTRLRP